MRKSKIFILGALSFAIGILIGSIFNISSTKILLFLAALGTGGLVLTVERFGKQLTFICLLLATCALGVIRMNSVKVSNQFQNALGEKHEFSGYIVEDADVRTDKQLVTFMPNGFDQKILLTAPLTQYLFYGDEVIVYGKTTEAKSDGDFDYQSYLKRFNIYALETYPKILVIRSNQQNKIKYLLLKIKHAVTRKIAKLYQEPQNSLLLGILIGAKKTLPQSIIDNFNATGTSHIIAVSGYNISIIVSNLSVVAYIVGRRKSFWVLSLLIAIFVVITGASASVVRAAIMGGLFLLSRSLGRQYHIAVSLFAAGFFMLIINPRILYYDVGFQLSFAATAGIIYFMPQLERLTFDWHNPLSIKTLLLVTLSAIISTLPILIYNFGNVSLVAPIVNILILPVIPLTMLLGFLSIVPWVGAGFAFVANYLLLYIMNIIKIFAHLPFASLPVNIPTWFYGGMIGCVFLTYYIVRYFAGLVKDVEVTVANPSGIVKSDL